MYYRGFTIYNKEKHRHKFPFNLPVFDKLQSLKLTSPVTVFVGENGSGKSTLLKSLALAMNLPAIGSSELDLDESLRDLQVFAECLRGSWSRKAYHGFFLSG